MPREARITYIAHANILLGTIAAYRKEYVKASYYFISGMKLGTNLSTPYCDFIRYILEKVSSLSKQEAKYIGIGYNANQPMGSIYQGEYDKWAAMQIIPCLEGENGELLLAHQGSSNFYGYLQHCGDYKGIDIYETYLIDKTFNLKTIKFYFNACFLPKEPKPIKLPKGFHINRDYAPNLQGKIIGNNGRFTIK